MKLGRNKWKAEEMDLKIGLRITKEFFIPFVRDNG